MRSGERVAYHVGPDDVGQAGRNDDSAGDLVGGTQRHPCAGAVEEHRGRVGAGPHTTLGDPCVERDRQLRVDRDGVPVTTPTAGRPPTARQPKPARIRPDRSPGRAAVDRRGPRGADLRASPARPSGSRFRPVSPPPAGYGGRPVRPPSGMSPGRRRPTPDADPRPPGRPAHRNWAGPAAPPGARAARPGQRASPAARCPPPPTAYL